MKKKLALLLVLSMVLSMIPMNVFGEGTYATVIGGPYRLEKNSAVAFTKSIRIDTTQVTSGSSILVTINDQGTITTPATGFSASTLNGGGFLGTIAGVAGQNYVDLAFGFTAGGTDKNDDIKVTIQPLANSQANMQDSQTIVVATHYEKSLSNTAGDLVSFSDVAALDTITISENAVGALLAGPHTVSLEIQQTGFSWRKNDVFLTSNGFLNGTYTPAAPGTPVTVSLPSSAPTNANLTGSSVSADGYTITLGSITTASSSLGTGNLKLEGLYIVADDKAKIGTTVTVKVKITNATASDPTSKTFDAISVAKYADYALELKLADSKNNAAYYEYNSGVYAAQTAKFVLTELTPNAFPTSRTSALSARFDMPEGVKLQSAKILMRDTGNNDTLVGSGGDPVEFVVGDPISESGVKVTPEALYVSPYIERGPINDIRYYMQIELYVNIEPGFEASYGDTITVDLGGTALENVKIVDTAGKSIDKEIDVATVVDQITVDVEPVEVALDSFGQYTLVSSVNEITITEAFAGALEQNTELWVYADSTRANDLSFTAASVSASGLKISRVTKLNRTDLPVGIRFTISKESEKDPGSIVISGGTIMGFLSAGYDYKIVVSGGAVAESNEAVTAEDLGKSVVDTIKLEPALFETSYNTSLFKYVGSTATAVAPVAPVEAAPAPVETAPVVTPEPTSWAMSSTTAVVTVDGETVVSPFIIPNDGPGKNIGYLSARVFANMIGGTSTWQDPQAILTNGEHTMVLQSGAETAVVDGQEVAIFTGPANDRKTGVPVLNFNGRFYVPARFAAECFGLNVDWNTASGIVTFYK